MDQNGRIFNSISGEEKDYVLKDMKESGLTEILELQNKVLTECGFNTQWFYPFDEEELKEILEGDSIALGVYTDGKLIAFRTGSFSGVEYDEITNTLGGKYKEKPCFLMNGVFVDKAYRGNHLQQKLSEYCIERCRKKGINTFLSVVHPDNIPSIKSLKNIGFKVEKQRKIFNGNYDRLILVKEMK
jgi:ribosomal protein S18 acetylase RimI-like enzyme